MRSLQVLNVDPINERKYSYLQVMKSAAGWYVGTLYQDDGQNAEPGSRDTDYFAKEEHAKLALAVLERLDERKYGQPENRSSAIIMTFEEILDILELNPRVIGYRIFP